MFFTPTGGTPIPATIANAATDWADAFILTTVPAGVTGDAKFTVQTAVATSNAALFTLVSSAAFGKASAAVIHYEQFLRMKVKEGRGAMPRPSSRSLQGHASVPGAFQSRATVPRPAPGLPTRACPPARRRVHPRDRGSDAG